MDSYSMFFVSLCLYPKSLSLFSIGLYIYMSFANMLQLLNFLLNTKFFIRNFVTNDKIHETFFDLKLKVVGKFVGRGRCMPFKLFKNNI